MRKDRPGNFAERERDALAEPGRSLVFLCRRHRCARAPLTWFARARRLYSGRSKARVFLSPSPRPPHFARRLSKSLNSIGFRTWLLS